MELAILSHILADFVFQTDSMAKNKIDPNKKISLKAHRYHGLTVFFTGFLLLMLPCSPDIALIYSLMIAIFHYIIDRIRSRFHSKIPRRQFIGFVIDQILHISIILVLWLEFENTFGSYKTWLGNIIYGKFDYLLSGLTKETVINSINVLIVYCFVCWGGAVIVNLTLNLLGINNEGGHVVSKEAIKESTIEANTSISLFPFKLPLKSKTDIAIKNKNTALNAAKENDEERRNLVSKYIGIFERLIIITLVIKNSYQAIAFVFAAKSLARANDLMKKSEEFTGYYLVGTLLSTAVAILGGMLLLTVLI
ncbi:MAG: DUF3307 domain-containing protein [Bacillota bacterium]|nr:DUF3307 domain-containing protein [Bacillota bacterium]